MRTDLRPGRARNKLRGAAALALVALLSLSLAACRQDMHDQPKLEPLEASPLFADGAASRSLVEGTVPRGHLRAEPALHRGVLPGGDFVPELPVPLTEDLLRHGRTRYEAFCAPCHDRLGTGRGMIVRRGFKQPASFHEARLREAAPGYFFTVMTNGFGQMSSYASQLDVRDRWAVVAYLRALQLSQGAPVELLTASDRERLAAAAEAPDASAAPAAEEAH